MALILPTFRELPYYRMRVPLTGASRIFDFHWNAREGAWYFDVLADDETVLAAGVKVILGATLATARRAGDLISVGEFGAFVVIDTSGEDREPGFDDIGLRTRVLWFSSEELRNLA